MTTPRRTRAPGAGRPPRAGVAAKHAVTVRMTEYEMRKFDEARGQLSRAEQFRLAVARRQFTNDEAKELLMVIKRHVGARDGRDPLKLTGIQLLALTTGPLRDAAAALLALIA